MFDEKGQCILTKRWHEDSTKLKYEANFEDGKIKRRIFYNPDGTIDTSKTKWAESQARNWPHPNPTEPPTDVRLASMSPQELTPIILDRKLDDCRVARGWFVWKTRDTEEGRRLRGELADKIVEKIHDIQKDPAKSLHDCFIWASFLGPFKAREQTLLLLRESPRFGCHYGPELVESLSQCGTIEDVPALIDVIDKESEAAGAVVNKALEKLTGVKMPLTNRRYTDKTAWQEWWREHNRGKKEIISGYTREQLSKLSFDDIQSSPSLFRALFARHGVQNLTVGDKDIVLELYKKKDPVLVFWGTIPNVVVSVKSGDRQTLLKMYGYKGHGADPLQEVAYLIPKTGPSILCICNPTGGNAWNYRPWYIISLEESSFLKNLGVVSRVRQDKGGQLRLSKVEDIWENGLGWFSHAGAPWAKIYYEVDNGKLVPDTFKNSQCWNDEIKEINKHIEVLSGKISRKSRVSIIPLRNTHFDKPLLRAILEKFLRYRLLGNLEKGWQELQKDLRHSDHEDFFFTYSEPKGDNTEVKTGKFPIWEIENTIQTSLEYLPIEEDLAEIDKAALLKCWNIFKETECTVDVQEFKQIPWELVSAEQKDKTVAMLAEAGHQHNSSDWRHIHLLGFMDPGYSFSRIAEFKNSQYLLARGEVADSIPLKGEFKEDGVRILVELLFDADRRVRMGTACTISRRLDKDDAIPLLLLYYFENIHQKPVVLRDAVREFSTDWVRAVAETEFRGVLVPWLEKIKEKGKDPVREWMNYDPPEKWAFWWDNARVEQTQAIIEGKKIASAMKEKYSEVIGAGGGVDAGQVVRGEV